MVQSMQEYRLFGKHHGQGVLLVKAEVMWENAVPVLGAILRLENRQ